LYFLVASYASFEYAILSPLITVYHSVVNVYTYKIPENMCTHLFILYVDICVHICYNKGVIKDSPISIPPVVSPGSNTKERRQPERRQNTKNKGATNMSTHELTAQIESLRALEELIEEAKAEAETLRDAIKQEMLNRDTEELSAGQYIVRWTSVLSQRFDTTAFKKVMPEVYKAYTKQVSSRRFTISA
jgi:predicted phage-related endonuclease